MAHGHAAPLRAQWGTSATSRNGVQGLLPLNETSCLNDSEGPSHAGGDIYQSGVLQYIYITRQLQKRESGSKPRDEDRAQETAKRAEYTASSNFKEDGPCTLGSLQVATQVTSPSVQLHVQVQATPDESMPPVLVLSPQIKSILPPSSSHRSTPPRPWSTAEQRRGPAASTFRSTLLAPLFPSFNDVQLQPKTCRFSQKIPGPACFWVRRAQLGELPPSLSGCTLTSWWALAIIF